MKANELRIGNWIVEPGQDDDKPFQVWGIYSELNNCKINNLPINYFTPIPLAEEWLLRFGFKWYPPYDSWVYKKNENTQEMIIRKYNVVCDMDFRPEIKYVHQLQNLYFALTGEELTITNK